MFRQLLIDRLGNAHRVLVDRYSLGNTVSPEMAELDADIAATLRDISQAPNSENQT